MYDRNLFDKKQLRQLRLCEEQGIDTSWANPDLNWRQMREIRTGLENGIDAYAYAAYPELTWQEMEIIRNDMEYGFVFDPDMYELNTDTGHETEKDEGVGLASSDPDGYNIGEEENKKDEKIMDYFEPESQKQMESFFNKILAGEKGGDALNIIEMEIMNHLDGLGIKDPITARDLNNGLMIYNNAGKPIVEILNNENTVTMNLNGSNFEKEKTMTIKDGEITGETDFTKKEIGSFTKSANVKHDMEKISLFTAMKEAKEIEAETMRLKKDIREITTQAYADGIMPEESKNLVNEKTKMLADKQKEIAAKIRQIGLKETAKDAIGKTKTFFKENVQKLEDKTGIMSKTAIRLAVIAELCRMREIKEGIKNIYEKTKEEIREIREDHKIEKDMKQYDREVRWENHNQRVEDIGRDTLTKDYLIAKAAKEHFEALEEKRVQKEEKYSAFKESIGDIKTAFGNIGRVITGKELEEFNSKRDNEEKPVSDFVKMADYYKEQMKEIELEFEKNKSSSIEKIDSIKDSLNEKYNHIQGFYSERTEEYIDTSKGFQAVIDSINNRKVNQFSEYGTNEDVKKSDIRKEIKQAKRDIKENKRTEDDRER